MFTSTHIDGVQETITTSGKIDDSIQIAKFRACSIVFFSSHYLCIERAQAIQIPIFIGCV
ncbi:MAG: hypothetical protein ABIS36_15490 [Chryseolinea sp.]